jgi:hypothetical protein
MMIVWAVLDLEKIKDMVFLRWRNSTPELMESKDLFYLVEKSALTSSHTNTPALFGVQDWMADLP